MDSYARLTAPAAAALSRDLGAVLDSCTQPTNAPLVGDPAAALRREVVDLLARTSELSCQGEMCPPISPVQAHWLVRKARAMLDEQMQANPSIESVARELGVSTRSLQRCFLTVPGLSPKQYFLACKLDAARRAMRRPGRTMRVVDIAHDLGFVSASRLVRGAVPSALPAIAFRGKPPTDVCSLRYWTMKSSIIVGSKKSQV